MARAVGQPSWTAFTASCPGVLPAVHPESATAPPLTFGPSRLLLPSGVAPSPVADLGVLTSPIPAETPGCRCTVSPVGKLKGLRAPISPRSKGGRGLRTADLEEKVRRRGHVEDTAPGQVWFKAQNQEPHPRQKLGEAPPLFYFLLTLTCLLFWVFACLVYCCGRVSYSPEWPHRVTM